MSLCHVKETPVQGSKTAESGIREDGSGQHAQALIGARIRTWHGADDELMILLTGLTEASSLCFDYGNQRFVFFSGSNAANMTPQELRPSPLSTHWCFTRSVTYATIGSTSPDLVHPCTFCEWIAVVLVK